MYWERRGNTILPMFSKVSKKKKKFNEHQFQMLAFTLSDETLLQNKIDLIIIHYMCTFSLEMCELFRISFDLIRI